MNACVISLTEVTYEVEGEDITRKKSCHRSLGQDQRNAVFYIYKFAV